MFQMTEVTSEQSCPLWLLVLLLLSFAERMQLH
jgi:hypothetical protein